MKSLMLMFAMIVGLAGALCAEAAPAYTLRVDGAWFDTDCFGCPNDTVITEVIQQQADFDAAAQEDESNRTVDSLKLCVKLALFSYDKAGYFLELGRLSGDPSYFQKAADAANVAIAIPANPKWKNRKGENVPGKSHRLGAKWLAVAQRHLGTDSK